MHNFGQTGDALASVLSQGKSVTFSRVYEYVRVHDKFRNFRLVLSLLT
jgi:hypothetical protein